MVRKDWVAANLQVIHITVQTPAGDSDSILVFTHIHKFPGGDCFICGRGLSSGRCGLVCAWEEDYNQYKVYRTVPTRRISSQS